MLVVVNTSPLIALERIGRLELLPRLYGTVLRPQSVLDELLAGQQKYALSDALIHSDWLLTKPDPPEIAFRRELGAGETAAITLAFKLEADLIILDDLQARLVAQSLGLNLTGTLGVLAAAYATGLLDSLETVLTELQDAGFRIAPALAARLRDAEA